MKQYKVKRTVKGGSGVYAKTFTFKAPASTASTRKFVDFSIQYEDHTLGSTYFGSLNLAQARTVITELTKFFGFEAPTPLIAGIGIAVAGIVKAPTTIPTPPPPPPHGKQEYKGNGKHSMEQVIDALYRLRVPGGWLYFDTYVDADDLSCTREVCGPTTFVPIPAVVGYKI